MKLRFEVQPDGSVLARVGCGDRLQGYASTLHGGVTAALLDAAMTNALFAAGVVAVTAELTVRYLEPVQLESDLTVCASVEGAALDSLYYLRASLIQAERVVAQASGKFVRRERP
jgi:uncharacterized protein (TIGR00369 family)